MTFKDQIAADCAVFLNTTEFGEVHQIQYRAGHGAEPIPAVVDEQRLTERGHKEYGDLYIGDILYFAPISAFVQPIKTGEKQAFDGKYYTVADVRSEDSIYEIILSKGA